MSFKTIEQVKLAVNTNAMNMNFIHRPTTTYAKDICKQISNFDNAVVFKEINVTGLAKMSNAAVKAMELAGVSVEFKDFNELPFNDMVIPLELTTPPQFPVVEDYTTTTPLLHISKATDTRILVSVFVDTAEAKTRMAWSKQHKKPYSSSECVGILNYTPAAIVSLSPDMEYTMIAIRNSHNPLSRGIRGHFTEDLNMYKHIHKLVAGILQLMMFYNTQEHIIAPAGNRSKVHRAKGGNTTPIYTIDISKPKKIYTKTVGEVVGTHQQPAEHERKGHTRHYKSGKVVHVRQTTVNKGSLKGKVKKLYTM